MGKSYTFGGFTAPVAPAGKYKMVLTKGKKTYEKEFELIYDKTSDITLEERQQQQEVSSKLYDITEELAYAVYKVDKMIAFGNNLKSKRQKINKRAGAMADNLTALKKTLVITTGDNYVGTSNPELREKLADLYSKVAGSFYAPSASDLESMAVIEERFNKAIKDLKEVEENDWQYLEKAAMKEGLDLPKIDTKSDFLAR